MDNKPTGILHLEGDALPLFLGDMPPGFVLRRIGDQQYPWVASFEKPHLDHGYVVKESAVASTPTGAVERLRKKLKEASDGR